MMTADQYGNSGAYFANNFNNATSFMLGIQSSGFSGKRPVSVYSVVGSSSTPPANLSTQGRISSPSAMIIGWQGPRPVAFPLVTGWNFYTPIT